jgi:hypothetical protein
MQPNTNLSSASIAGGLILADQTFKDAVKTLGVARYQNGFVPPNTSQWFGSDCTKFYLRSADSQSHCQNVAYLDEDYAIRFRTDSSNLLGTKPYQLIVLGEEVVVDLQDDGGLVLGATSPHNDDPTSAALCSYVFATQIDLALLDLVGNCGYVEGAKAGYRAYIARWTIIHELGRQIGGLHATYDINYYGEHNQRTLLYDIMGSLGQCDPVNQTAHGFCRDTDPDMDTTNSCVDRLKTRFP